MANERAEVRVFGDVNIYVSDAEPSFPTDAETTISTSVFASLGFCTTDGVRPKFGREEKDIFAHQSLDPVRSLTTGAPKSLEVDLMQTNRRIFQVAMGGGTFTEDAGVGTVTYSPPDDDVNTERGLLVEFIDGDFVYRFCYRRVKQIKEVVYAAKRDDAAMWPLEFKVLKPTTGTSWFFQSNDSNFLDAGLAS